MATKVPLSLRLATRRKRVEVDPDKTPSQPDRSRKVDTDAIAQINNLVSTGKAAWVVLLSYLAFIGITLLGVEDADFFIPERQTELPLVGVSIPTILFFWVAPALGASLFVYFQLQLLKLWEAIAKARDTVMAAPEKISPWMVVDFALNRIDPNVLQGRPLRIPILIATRLMIFWAAPIVLGAFWYWSMPYHHEGLTIIGCGLPFMAALATALKSGLYLKTLLGIEGRYQRWGWRAFANLQIILVMIFVVVVGWLTTEGSLERYVRHEWHLDLFGITDFRLQAYDEPVTYDPNNGYRYTNPAHDTWWGSDRLNFFLVSADLAGVDFVGLPGTWRDYDTTRDAFRLEWCDDQGISAAACGSGAPVSALSANRQDALIAARNIHCADLSETSEAVEEPEAPAATAPVPEPDCAALFAEYDTDFQTAWSLEWQAFLANLDPRDLSGADMRGASLAGARLQGVEFRGAQLQGADLFMAQVQGADLWEAQLQDANLSGAQMQRAVLFQAQLQGTDLSDAQLQGAFLRSALLQGADLRSAQLQRADLVGAQMHGTELHAAQLQGANLVGAQLQGADLRAAKLQGADLSSVRMQAAVLVGAELQSADLIGAQMQGADLRGAQLHGADLRGTVMSEDTDLRAAALQGAAVRSLDDTTLTQLERHLPEMFTGGDDLSDDAYRRAWRAFQDTLPDFPEEWKVQLPD